MDTIANFLTQIRNAQAVKKETVRIPFSRLNYKIAKILSKESFIEQVKKKGRKTNKSIIITLNYEDDEPKIRVLKRVSKPGRRVYRPAEKIKPVRNGYGIAIISTSQGLMTDHQARKKKVGGEILCKVW